MHDTVNAFCYSWFNFLTSVSSDLLFVSSWQTILTWLWKKNHIISTNNKDKNFVGFWNVIKLPWQNCESASSHFALYILFWNMQNINLKSHGRKQLERFSVNNVYFFKDWVREKIKFRFIFIEYTYIFTWYIFYINFCICTSNVQFYFIYL